MRCFSCIKSSGESRRRKRKVCCSCRNGPMDEDESSRGERERGVICFCCVKSKGCCVKSSGAGCFCYDKSSKAEDSSRKKGGCGMCCFGCDKSSKEEESLRKKGGCGKCCFGNCHKSSKEEESLRKKGGCGKCCFGCGKSSNEEASSKKKGGCGMCCFGCDKSSKEEETLEKKGKRGRCCFFCSDSSKEEESTSNEEKASSCSSCTKSLARCFCCSKSPKEQSRSGEKEKGCFHCKNAKSCFCCKKSPKKEETEKCRARCFCCRKSVEEERKPPSKKQNGGVMSCLCCCKSPEGERKTAPRRKKCCCWKRKQKKKPDQLATLVKSISFKSDGEKHRSAAEEILRVGSGNIAAQVFTYRELTTATGNFDPDRLIGEGGFGKVYKGKLQDTDQIIAVKQLDRKGYQGDREFLVEVLMLSRLHHQNLVNLIGYCADGNQRILVYDYMPLGSLQDHLLDLPPNAEPLDWNTRMKIAAGTAKGLEYLHDMANPPVIYRDFKASNILLDEDFNPRLSDFGLAKLGPVGDKNHVSTRVMGTYGYCAPEYALTGQLTKMSDVYSYGVVLLELITGRKAIDTSRPRHEQQLVQWAGPRFRDKKRYIDMADPLLERKFSSKSLYQALAVAAMCLQDEASTRPLIRDVVTALEYLADPNYDQLTEGQKESMPRNLLPSDSDTQRGASGSNELDGESIEDSDWQSCSTATEDEERLKQDLDMA